MISALLALKETRCALKSFADRGIANPHGRLLRSSPISFRAIAVFRPEPRACDEKVVKMEPDVASCANECEADVSGLSLDSAADEPASLLSSVASNSSGRSSVSHEGSDYYSCEDTTRTANGSPVEKDAGGDAHCFAADAEEDKGIFEEDTALRISDDDAAFGVLSPEQFARLDAVLERMCVVHGVDRFPTIKAKLKGVIRLLRNELTLRGVCLRDVRLCGGAAAHVVGGAAHDTYNDVDVIFNVDCADGSEWMLFSMTREAVTCVLAKLFPGNLSSGRIGMHTLEAAYVAKMFKMPSQRGYESEDCWSLVTLRNLNGQSIDLKFVKRMRRQCEFSIDSFQISLSPQLLELPEIPPIAAPAPVPVAHGVVFPHDGSVELEPYGAAWEPVPFGAFLPVSDDGCLGEYGAPFVAQRPGVYCDAGRFMPVQVESVYYNDYQGALEHLRRREIFHLNPQEVRGGGLLKYCHLLCRGFSVCPPPATEGEDASARAEQEQLQLEKYMFNRFSIDFSTIAEQHEAIAGYYWNHLVREGDVCDAWLATLATVVLRAGVEVRSILRVICGMRASMGYAPLAFEPEWEQPAKTPGGGKGRRGAQGTVTYTGGSYAPYRSRSGRRSGRHAEHANR